MFAYFTFVSAVINLTHSKQLHVCYIYLVALKEFRNSQNCFGKKIVVSVQMKNRHILGYPELEVMSLV
jgi:hypothetical protein